MNRRLPGLEVLRLVAASCVLFLHALANYGGARWFGRGYLGVDFFLMLSGFLMARVQEDRLAAGLSPWGFMVKRYARLWPMMALGGLIGLPRLFIRDSSLWDALWVAVANMALLPVPGHQFVTPLNVPAWTITCELLCNSAHVLLLWRIRGRWLWLLLAALLPVEIGIGWHYGYYNVGAQPANFFAGVARTLFAYTLGIALSRWWRNGVPFPVPWWLALPLMPVLLVGAVMLGLWGWWYELGFILLACPLMIAGAMRLERGGKLAGWMGLASFPLFALQMPILEGLRMLHGTYWQAVSLAYGVSIAVAIMSQAWQRHRKNHKAM
jgi:peptidoglycan/LPS O-acetylase OafA/YrhL